ncbi:MAG: hypothetical protein KBT45_02395 [Bacteroidales bacterium]|nr:hypothetical protein [Candidatus Colimorpha pelethequi]
MKKVVLSLIIAIMGSMLLSCDTPGIAPDQYGKNLIGTWRLENENGHMDFELSGKLWGTATTNMGDCEVFIDGVSGGTGHWSIEDDNLVTIGDLHQKILVFRIDKMTSETIEGTLEMNSTSKIILKRVNK